MSLKGSKTEENLKEAFAGESQANRRYLYFAQKADIEGYNDVAAVFRSTAEGETGHAHGHLEYLEEVGDPGTGMPIGETKANLASAVQGDNSMKLFTAISGSATITAGSNRNYGIQARSSEQVKSSFYFVRVKNAEYNYSNNPSYVTGSLGEMKYTTFVNDPQAYITTVGLYNNNRELLAVAKLSQPLLKNKTKEILVKVKLDF